MVVYALPLDRDVVLCEEGDDDVTVYVLYSAAGRNRMSFRRRKDALATAMAMAQRDVVRVWARDAPNEFTLIHNARASSARPRRHDSERPHDCPNVERILREPGHGYLSDAR